jgi:hypothetical protein
MRGCPGFEACMAQSIFDQSVRANAIESHGMNPLTEPSARSQWSSICGS